MKSPLNKYYDIQGGPVLSFKSEDEILRCDHFNFVPGLESVKVQRKACSNGELSWGPISLLIS